MYGNDDLALRYGNAMTGTAEWFHRLAGNELFVGLLCALVIVLLIALVERKKQAIAFQLSIWANWCKVFFLSAGCLLVARWRGKAMRQKKQEEFAKRIQTVLIHMIDTAVEKKGVTQTMANVELRKLARAYPEMRHAIWHPVDTKEAVVERRKNEDRNPDGTVVPLPLP